MTEGEPKPWSNEWVRERETVQVLDIPDLGPAPDQERWPWRSRPAGQSRSWRDWRWDWSLTHPS
jgi:uncharacterized protein YfiM (DUF2279 family)